MYCSLRYLRAARIFWRASDPALSRAMSRYPNKSRLIPANPASPQHVSDYQRGTVLQEWCRRNGAGYRTRTCDPLITNQVLYQLS